MNQPMHERYALDLTRNHFTKACGDLTLIGTWYWDDEEEDYEPCLVILPTFRRATPCVVALSAAYKYNNVKYMVRSAHFMGKCLGFDANATTTHRIATLIYDHLPDLVKIPPKPIETSEVIGQATMTHESGRVESFDLIEDR